MKFLKNKNILIIIIIYLYIVLENFLCRKNCYNNTLNIVFWLCMCIYLIIYIRKTYIRLNKNKRYFLFMIILSSIYTIIYFYIGFVVGFLKSPYSHIFLTIIKNILLKIIPISAIEITRWILLTRNRKNNILIVIITITLFLAEIKYNVLFSLFENREELFKYVFFSIIPIEL